MIVWWRWSRPAVLVALTGVVLVGCDDLLDDTQDLPDFAAYELTGTSPVDLEVIVSTNFAVVSDFETQSTFVDFFASDTTLSLPPLSGDRDIRATERFFVRVTNYSDSIADIRLRVSFDGVFEYDQAAFMSGGASLEFSQIFSGT